MFASSDIYVIPDIHGRDFWRGHLCTIQEDRHYVFLGDYLDPYDDDCISWDDAFKGLLDVIALKREHPDKVTLLFGNHDLHYLFNELTGSRKNPKKADIIKGTLEDNMDCFQMAEETVIAGKRILFTHAGVHRSWAFHHQELFGPMEEIGADTFNHLMFTPEFVKALSETSLWRGGYSYVGSMIWEDARAYRSDSALLPGYIQLFGHTMQHDGAAVINQKLICVDCQMVFLLKGHDGRPLLEDLPWRFNPIQL